MKTADVRGAGLFTRLCFTTVHTRYKDQGSPPTAQLVWCTQCHEVCWTKTYHIAVLLSFEGFHAIGRSVQTCTGMGDHCSCCCCHASPWISTAQCLCVSCSTCQQYEQCVWRTTLLRQLYVLPHCDRSWQFKSDPIEVNWHQTRQSHHWTLAELLFVHLNIPATC